jgi:hypothetical protein
MHAYILSFVPYVAVICHVCTVQPIISYENNQNRQPDCKKCVYWEDGEFEMKDVIGNVSDSDDGLLHVELLDF